MQDGTSFGAPTALENELAELILSNNRFIEKIRFVSSGTEAVMSAIRLARGFTGRDKILKFEGCYHGHVDALLVNAGSGLVTFGTSSSAGIPEAFANETLVLPLNDVEALKKCFEEFGHDIACVIIEPIPANNGLLLQDNSFLNRLRTWCSEYGILLIFDEVISGFRVAFGGAAELYGIYPDIVTYGKIIGGGLPVGAYGARKEIMQFVSPDGPVYQAGTLSGNPIAMAAGLAQLKGCSQESFYREMANRTTDFVNNINAFCEEKKYPLELVSIGSIFWFSFNGHKKIQAASQINPDMSKFNELHHFLLNEGVYFGPSGYEVGFISEAHQVSDLEFAIEKIKLGFDAIYGGN
jgi:glutamate-1-semialdehyde 2,1-aminomutase